MSRSTEVNINVDKILDSRGLGRNSSKSKKFIGNEIIRLADPLVPFREGYLRNSAKVAQDGSYIIYETPYATRWYYEPANFNGAPTRGNKWVERAININEQALKESYAKFLKEGAK